MIWLFFAALLWGPSFGFIPILIRNHGMDAYTLAFFRMFYSLLMFLPLLRVHVIARRKRVILIGLGAVQFGGMYVCLNLSYGFMEGYEVAMVTVFTPIYVSLIDSLFVKSRGQLKSWLCVGLAVAGAMVIQYARPESRGFWIGFSIMQVANLCFAFGQVAYRRLLPDMKRFGDMHVFGWMYFGGMIVTALAWTIWGEPVTALRNLSGMSVKGWLILCWLGLVPSGLGFFLFNHGALSVNTHTLSIFNNLKIPLAIIIVMVVFGQWDYVESWSRFFIGAFVMLAALWWNEQPMEGRHRKKLQPANP